MSFQADLLMLISVSLLLLLNLLEVKLVVLEKSKLLSCAIIEVQSSGAQQLGGS